MDTSLFSQGVDLMLVGMGTVFVFLTLLVVAMSLMAGIIRRLSPIAEEGIGDEEVAAITAAIARHRNKKS